MEEVLSILKETPWWVYLIFAFLIIICLRASKPRTVSIRQLIIFPAILTIWGLIEIKWHFLSLLLWACSIAIGFGLGWLAVRKWKIRYDRSRKTIHLPGSYSTLVLALLFFAVRYFFGFYKATHSVVPLDIMIWQASASGIITGVFLGRLAFYWKHYEEI